MALDDAHGNAVQHDEQAIGIFALHRLRRLRWYGVAGDDLAIAFR